MVGSKGQGKKILDKLFKKFDTDGKLKSVSLSKSEFMNLRKYFLEIGVNKHRRIAKIKAVKVTDRSFEFTMRNGSGGTYRAVSITEEPYVKIINDNTSGTSLSAFNSLYGFSGTEATQLDTLRTVALTLGSKVKAIYPQAGTTEFQHSGNLMVAATGDAAYQLTFHGVWTHNSDGIKSDGLNTSWADTHFLPSTGVAAVPSFYMGAYMKENTAPGSTLILMGCKTSSPNTGVYLSIETSNFGSVNGEAGGTAIITQSAASNYGSYISISRESSTLCTLRRRTTSLGTVATSTTTLPIGVAIYIGAFNFAGTVSSPCNRTYRTVVIADGLTSAEHTTLFNAIEVWETFKGRNIA